MGKIKITTDKQHCGTE